MFIDVCSHMCVGGCAADVRVRAKGCTVVNARANVKNACAWHDHAMWIRIRVDDT